MMNLQINQLVKSLLQKDTLEQCSLEELEQYAERHPYFGAAQLLLTKKLQAENPGRYDEQLQKTFLFFNNPLWVEHLLNETGHAEIIAPEKKEELPVYVEVAPEILTEDPLAITPEADQQVEDILDKTVPEEIRVPEEVEETVAAMATTPDTVIVEQITSPAALRDTDDTTLNNESPTAIDPLEHVTTTETETQLQAAAGEPSIPFPAFKIEPIDPAKAELVFEPFHTVDYFASQGIRFKEEVKPTDKFGVQLKSFTDWLKSMKKLPVTEIAKLAEANTSQSALAEKKVEELAEHSIAGKDVVTETMAEVWEKQGNHAKAIGVYEKLSLLEPSKSTYFASKIADLKKIN